MRLERLTIIIIVALWECADDVITGHTAPSVVQRQTNSRLGHVIVKAAVRSVHWDVSSPVFVQEPPQVTDCFRRGHFHYVNVAPVFWLHLESDDITGRLVGAESLQSGGSHDALWLLEKCGWKLECCITNTVTSWWLPSFSDQHIQ